MQPMNWLAIAVGAYLLFKQAKDSGWLDLLKVKPKPISDTNTPIDNDGSIGVATFAERQTAMRAHLLALRHFVAESPIESATKCLAACDVIGLEISQRVD